MTLMVRFLLALTVAAAPAAANAQRSLTSPVEPFDSVFKRVARVALLATPEEPIGLVRFVAVRNSRVFVVDDSNRSIKDFDLASGKLITTIGRSGNGPREICRIAGIFVDSVAAITTVDNARGVLVRRDPDGRFVKEMRLPGAVARDQRV